MPSFLEYFLFTCGRLVTNLVLFMIKGLAMLKSGSVSGEKLVVLL